jgi:hypothetical protein
MTTITLDKETRARLNGLDEFTWILDENGNLLGVFLSPAMYRDLSCASLEIPLSEEEIERRRKETGGRSLAEIWKSLGQQP